MFDVSELKEEIQKKFEELQFEELKHEYQVNNKSLISVSHFIKNYTEEFNELLIAHRVAKSRGCTVGEVLLEWKEARDSACDLGTATHLFGENFIETGECNPSNGYEEALIAFWCNLPDKYIPVTLELRMYCVSKGIAGTADIILLNKETGKFVIADYKTNKNIYKNYNGKKLKVPFNDMFDSPFDKYTIQLSLYQILFELTGYEVEERFLIWLKPDSSYEVLPTQDVRNRIEKLYDF